MLGHGLDDVVVERQAAACRAECAILDMTARAAGDLADFRRRQRAVLPTVELAVARKGDVIDIEIETHAYGVGRDDEIDVAVLIHLDLRVARARTERTEHDGGPAALAADEFGNGVNFLGRECDNGRAGRQARQFALAGEGQAGQARPRYHGYIRQQPLHQRPHGGGPDDDGFFPPAPMQKAVGKNAAAVEIGRKLYLVDRDESDVDIGMASTVAIQ